MNPRYLPAKDCAGYWVRVSIGQEAPAWAKCTSSKDLDTLFVSLSLAEHPTCGHVKLDIPKNRSLEIKLNAARKPVPIGATELW